MIRAWWQALQGSLYLSFYDKELQAELLTFYSHTTDNEHLFSMGASQRKRVCCGIVLELYVPL